MLSDDYAWWRLELHLCLVAMTTGVLACELAIWGGMAWAANFIPLGSGEPFSGIWPHELGPEGGTGLESIDFKGTIVVNSKHKAVHKNIWMNVYRIQKKLLAYISLTKR